MHLKRFSTILLTSHLLLANELPEDILSKDRLEIFNLTKEQIKEDNSKLRKDWISPIVYKLSKNYEDDNEYDPLSSSISVNQPIFKSGGIYQAIQYANSFEKFANIDLEIQKRNLIRDAVRLLFQIHKIELTIKKQELLIANAELDILRRREEVLNGISDTSFLNNAILDASIVKNALADLIYEKDQLINNFNSLASSSYDNFELPKFSLINSEKYIKNNLSIKKFEEDIISKDYFKQMTISKYLPEINFTYNYTKYHDNYDKRLISSSSQDMVGLNLTIPFDTRTFNDIESEKIEYLKSKISLNTTILEEENFYKTAIAQIQAIESKKKIAKDDFELYNSLLDDITQAANAGLNSYADVQTLQNSKEIKSYDIKILELDRQLELLELYAKQLANS